MNIALVDATSGQILWYVFSRTGGIYDLRDRSSVNTMVKGLLSGFHIP